MNVTIMVLENASLVIFHHISVLVFSLASTEYRWILKNDSVLLKAQLGIECNFRCCARCGFSAPATSRMPWFLVWQPLIWKMPLSPLLSISPTRGSVGFQLPKLTIHPQRITCVVYQCLPLGHHSVHRISNTFLFPNMSQPTSR